MFLCMFTCHFCCFCVSVVVFLLWRSKNDHTVMQEEYFPSHWAVKTHTKHTNIQTHKKHYKFVMICCV